MLRYSIIENSETYVMRNKCSSRTLRSPFATIGNNNEYYSIVVKEKKYCNKIIYAKEKEVMSYQTFAPTIINNASK